MTTNADIEETVHRNLNDALNNGYAETMRRMSDAELALELTELCSEVEDRTCEEVLPHVTTWRAKTPEARA
jgi:hypothetical protein